MRKSFHYIIKNIIEDQKIDVPIQPFSLDICYVFSLFISMNDHGYLKVSETFYILSFHKLISSHNYFSSP